MKEDFQHLAVTVEGGVDTVLLRSRPLNIITRPLLEELDMAFQNLEFETGLRAVVLSSGLPGIFCAGADIKQFQSWTSTTGSENCMFGAQVFQRIACFPRPVLCAVNGNAFGGGLELAMACDIRIFDEDIQVSLPESSLGMQPGYGGTQRLPRLVGPSYAKKLMMTGLPITAQEALRVGLADQLGPAGGGSLETALEMARVIAHRAPIAVARIKKSVEYAMEHCLDEGIVYENRGISLLCGTRDKQEGASAFVEKRPPQFQNH